MTSDKNKAKASRSEPVKSSEVFYIGWITHLRPYNRRKNLWLRVVLSSVNVPTFNELQITVNPDAPEAVWAQVRRLCLSDLIAVMGFLQPNKKAQDKIELIPNKLKILTKEEVFPDSVHPLSREQVFLTEGKK